MKELYISPELNVVCFAPVERLAGDGFDLDEFLPDDGSTEEIVSEPDDFDFDFFG